MPRTQLGRERRTPPPPSPMQTRLLLFALAWLSLCQRVAGLGLNATEPEGNVSVAWDHSAQGHAVASGSDYEEDEEEEQDPTAPMYIVDESIRVEPVIKPKQTKTEKNPDKTKRKRLKGKKNKKKKGTPCDTEYRNFCIHGECRYLEELKEVTCKCHEDYFGERCGEQFMKTQRRNDISNYSTTVLVVVAVLLSSISFFAIVVIVTMQTRFQTLFEWDHLRAADSLPSALIECWGLMELAKKELERMIKGRSRG